MDDVFCNRKTCDGGRTIVVMCGYLNANGVLNVFPRMIFKHTSSKISIHISAKTVIENLVSSWEVSQIPPLRPAEGGTSRTFEVVEARQPMKRLSETVMRSETEGRHTLGTLVAQTGHLSPVLASAS